MAMKIDFLRYRST